MMNWRLEKIENVLTLEYGKGLPKRKRIFGKYPVFGSGGIIDFHNKALINKSGIIVGRKGSIGTVYYSNEPFFPIDTVFFVNIKNDYNLKYLYYFLSNIGLPILNSDAAVPGLNRNWVHSLKAYLSPLPIQKKIAAILSAYDELIENNNRRIAILEKMAEEIYREWFVRLRFPGYEKVKVVKGVPEGWEMKKVEDIGEIITGKTPSTFNQKYFNGKYPFIKTPDMHENLFILKTKETLSDEGIKSQPSQTIPANSICVSCIGTGGVGIVSCTTRISQTNQQINSVIPREKYFFSWALYTLKELKETIKMFGATGTTMINLSKGKFSNLKILFPNTNLLKRFNKILIPLFEEIVSLGDILNNLKKSRDQLLPRLISGKLDVEKLDIAFPPGMKESPEEQNA